MKKIALLAAAFMAFACTEKNTTSATTPKDTLATDTIGSPTEVSSTESTDSIFTGSVTNNAGSTLKQSYNKTKGTAVFEVNGETIIAKQDTVASGIQYSNEHYIYKEHRGDISIYKDGKLFWDNIR